MELASKVALVTGGTDGIGLEIARQLKARGARVIVCGRRTDLIARARDEGLEAIKADLSTREGCAALANSVADRPLSLLVNNAGMGGAYDWRGAVDLDLVDQVTFLNFNAPLHLIGMLLPNLRQQPQAAIVNVTSGLAIAPRSGSPVYCATKAALRSFTMALRAQLKGSGIHVIEALPPVVDTAMTIERKGRKQSPRDCAAEIVTAIEADRAEVNPGMTKLLRIIDNISPALARRIMIRY